MSVNYVERIVSPETWNDSYYYTILHAIITNGMKDLYINKQNYSKCMTWSFNYIFIMNTDKVLIL